MSRSQKQRLYDTEFYAGQACGSLSSARIIMPLVWEHVAPQSVIDVGCGVGAWLSAAHELGAVEIMGVDGDYVDRGQLLVDPSWFVPADLTARLRVGRQFDLAMSLEVAEHLPESRAGSFVEDLTRIAPAVLFSAAIPGQGGTGHINEQWHSYWAELFSIHDYRPIDLRPAIWRREEVTNWYRQNTVLYVHESHPAAAVAQAEVLDLVHPDHYAWAITRPLYLKRIARALPWAVRHTVVKRLFRFRANASRHPTTASAPGSRG